MALHQDQVARIHEWLTAHVHAQCPTCGLSNWWRIHDGLYGLPSVSLDSLNLREGLELTATTCKRCGYTAFFLAASMGVGPHPVPVDFP
jgi:predicted nucleic-acid-binding Zn-ribbon protein